MDRPRCSKRFASSARAATGPEAPLAVKNPHYPAQAKSCIFLFMYGGPSQVDLFDPKPELKKRHGQPIPNLDKDTLFKVRNPGPLLGSSRKFIKCGKSGIEISDLFPTVGKCADDIAWVREQVG